LVPGQTPLTNKAPYLFRRVGTAKSEAFLLGVLCSIPLDWYCRRYVEVGMNLTVLRGLPIPRPGLDDPLAKRVVEIAGTLAAVDGRYDSWAAEVGVKVAAAGPESRRTELMAELDAIVALLYGLTAGQLGVVFETFHRGWHYPPRLARVLAHYNDWEGKR